MEESKEEDLKTRLARVAEIQAETNQELKLYKSLDKNGPPLSKKRMYAYELAEDDQRSLDKTGPFIEY